MVDRIFVEDLRARCIIGVNPDERRAKQDVLVSLVLETDTRPAAATDRLEDALDYRAIKKDVLAYVEASTHGLLETLAEEIATLCLKAPRTRAVTVRVDKPGALRFARNVAVEITRSREDV